MYGYSPKLVNIDSASISGFHKIVGITTNYFGFMNYIHKK